MNASNPELISIFCEALERAAPAERSAYLDSACSGNAELKQRIVALLEAHDRAGNFLAGDRPPPDEPPAERPGAAIGPYRLIRLIGEGGMGAVWQAEQSHPVHRTVALKLIKPGMDSRQVLARFEAERQALALMDHPNIARVLDAGASNTGRPYFVMELVEGATITKYCDDHHLTPRQRLELFVPVCQAVQHAHQKGIIHRDIKPGNVLVTLYDDRPVPKVIDFGVAKATGHLLSEESLHTGLGTVVGTFEYMSPEQASLNTLDVDTRSDIYSLGVLLYELLTGSPPFTRKELERAGLLEMLRVIREQEPSKPSTKLSTADGLPSLAADRGTEPARLTRLVRGDLDWIVMKCLEKDRNRRYETANGFAMDLQRYLADEPVQARPPSRGYRLRKFVRRNRGAVLAASLVLLALVGGIIGTSWGMVRAQRAREDEAAQRAIAEEKEQLAQAAAEAEKKASATARARESETQAVLSFVESKVFAAARPKGQEMGLGRDVPLRAAIEAAVPFVDKSFTNEPLIEARLRMTLGASFRYLGDWTRAAEQFRKARALYERHLGPTHLDTLKSMTGLAVAVDALGRHDEALPLRLEVFEQRKARLGDTHPETISSMINLANSYSMLGQDARALALRKETLALAIAHLGANHPDTFLCMSNLANSHVAAGEQREALELREKALTLRKNHTDLGPTHPDTLLSMNNLSVSYDFFGRHEEALALRKETLAQRIAKLGPDHPDTLNSMHNLAFSHAALGQHDRALEIRRETLERRKAHPQIGPDHPDTFRSMHALALSLSALNRHQEALDLHRETRAKRESKLGPDHPETLKSMYEIAKCLFDMSRGDDAVLAIDDYVNRAVRKGTDPKLIFDALFLRLDHFAKAKDPDGCRATAAMWEKLNLTDAESAFRAARLRAATSTVQRGIPGDESARLSQLDADRAMDWLRKAVAAGFRDAERLKTNPDLAALRERDDFKQLCAQLEAGAK